MSIEPIDDLGIERGASMSLFILSESANNNNNTLPYIDHSGEFWTFVSYPFSLNEFRESANIATHQ